MFSSPARGFLLTVLFVFSVGVWLAAPVESTAIEAGDYYRSVRSQSPTTLRNSLHRLISQQRHLGYSSLWEHYKRTDRSPDGTVRDIYSDCTFKRFGSDQGGSPGKECGYLSREHTWPKSSWGGGRVDAYSDLFNVLPGDAHTNGQKGLRPPGEVGSDYYVSGVTKFGPARDGLGYSGPVFEPADRYKGDFARIYLYFVVRYLTGEQRLSCSDWPLVRDDGKNLKPWAIRVLLRWHRQDPVSKVERLRNQRVYEIQGNRNPFVDHPEWANKIWTAESDPSATPTLIGVDANYWLKEKRAGATWTDNGETIQIFSRLAEQGVDRIRIRLWVGDTGPGGLRYATRTARNARKHGLKPYLVVFLSDRWADYVKQPVPARWEDLSLEQQVERVRRYTERVGRHFRSRGIDIDQYEIGNEIDFGISGVFEQRWSHRFNLEWMKTKIWPEASKIIKAAQSGILKADSDARFILHLAQWWNPDFAIEFYRTMLNHDIKLDYLGLSYFPTSNLSENNRLKDLGKIVDTLRDEINRPVIIPEFAYPSSDQIEGQFAGWNQPVPGYLLTPEGQKQWIRDFIKFAKANPGIEQVYYWSPEWYSAPFWQPFALFDPAGRAKPGFTSLRD